MAFHFSHLEAFYFHLAIASRSEVDRLGFNLLASRVRMLCKESGYLNQVQRDEIEAIMK